MKTQRESLLTAFRDKNSWIWLYAVSILICGVTVLAHCYVIRSDSFVVMIHTYTHTHTLVVLLLLCLRCVDPHWRNTFLHLDCDHHNFTHMLLCKHQPLTFMTLSEGTKSRPKYRLTSWVVRPPHLRPSSASHRTFRKLLIIDNWMICVNLIITTRLRWTETDRFSALLKFRLWIINDNSLTSCFIMYNLLVEFKTHIWCQSCLIDWPRSWKHPSDVDVMASRSCCGFVGCTSMMWISSCSVGLRSRWHDSGGRVSPVSSLTPVWDDLIVVTWSLSSWKKPSEDEQAVVTEGSTWGELVVR